MKNADVQLRLLVLQDVAGGDLIRSRPGIDRTQVEEQGEEQQRHEGQRHHRRLERPADQEAPGAADQVVEHQDRQAAERDPEAEDVGRQVRRETAGRSNEQPSTQTRQAADPRDQEARAADAPREGVPSLRPGPRSGSSLAPSFSSSASAPVGRDVVEHGVLAQLQGADVGDDRPAVVGSGSARHRSTSRRSRW